MAISGDSFSSNHARLLSCLSEMNEFMMSSVTTFRSLEPKYEELCTTLNDYYSEIGRREATWQFEKLTRDLVEMIEKIGEVTDLIGSKQCLVLETIRETNIFFAAACDTATTTSNSSSSSESAFSSLSGSSPNAMTADSSSDQKRKSAVEGTILPPDQNTSNFSKIAGLCNAKRIIRQALIMPMLLPNLFSGVDVKPWTRILLYGPPGTGKTELARALAAEIRAVFFNVSSSDIVSCMLGDSEKIIRDIFSSACKLKSPSLIFIDEIDSVARSRTATEEEHNRRIKTELLVQLSHLERRPASDPPVTFICATNLPWDIDFGILRRFQKRIYIPLPNNEARQSLLKMHSDMVGARLTDSEIGELVCATQGYSPHDIVCFVQEAFFQRIADLENCETWIYDGSRGLWTPCADGMHADAVHCSLVNLPPALVAPCPPDMSNFRKALVSAKSTVASEVIAQFEEFTNKFGVSGE